MASGRFQRGASLRVSDFDFDLPARLIAQFPPEERGSSKLMRLDRQTGDVAHGAFADLPRWLRRGDLLVVNDTKVFPARLLGRREPGGGAVECLLLSRTTPPAASAAAEEWRALVSPGSRVSPGTRLVFERDGVRLDGEVVERAASARLVRLSTLDGTPVMEAVERLGHVPLPPYIKRADAASDHDRYQTVYARHSGSIAAPTAGLHFTPATFQALAAAGVERTSITLHVGYGTFQPVRVEHVEEHRMASEHYEVGAEAADALTRALAEGRRIVAVGTTTTRTLESLPIEHGRVAAGRGDTALFISPGFRFRLVSGLVTNFHVPRSSLLMLVSAFAGVDHVREAYAQAVAAEYRFYSYGDAMLVL
ncbi:MAG: tRNA preQ1(34) S-adenosylmethionine ribosyltransferase-isomerase QueA [Vicinamibacterales bacterium]